MQYSCSRNTLQSNICCIVLNQQFRQSKKWSNNWPLSVKIFWFSRQFGHINSETHLYRTDVQRRAKGERNEIRAARVFPLPLLRLWITPLRQLPTAAEPPHHSRGGERREKTLKSITIDPLRRKQYTILNKYLFKYKNIFVEIDKVIIDKHPVT